MTPATQTERAALLTALHAAPCWRAQRGYGTFLTFDFGAKVAGVAPDGSPAEKGEYHLWVYLCEWRIQAGAKTLADFETPWETVDAALAQLTGQTIKAIDAGKATATVAFSGDLALVMTSLDDQPPDPDDDFFMLFLPDGRTLSYHPARGLAWSVP